MAQTTFGVPYPVPTDPVSQGAGDIQAVAEALDSRVLAGSLAWGPPGASPDVSLYRSSPGNLYTAAAFNAASSVCTPLVYFGPIGTYDVAVYRRGPGALEVNADFYAPELAVAAGTAGETWLGPEGPGGQAGFLFGQAWDTNLYRQAAGQLRTDGDFDVGGQLWLRSDIERVYFGSAADTTLYRQQAQVLKTEEMFAVGGQLFTGHSGGNGAIYFGVAQDTVIYRVGAGTLQTNGPLMIGGTARAAGYVAANDLTANQVAIGYVTSGVGPGISFGAASDAAIYRAGASVLRTDGALTIGSLRFLNYETGPVSGSQTIKIPVYTHDGTLLGKIALFPF